MEKKESGKSFLHGSDGARIPVKTMGPGEMPNYGKDKAKSVQTGGVAVDHAGGVPPDRK